MHGVGSRIVIYVKTQSWLQDPLMSYGMTGLGSSASIPSPDSSLKPDLRWVTCFKHDLA